MKHYCIWMIKFSITLALSVTLGSSYAVADNWLIARSTSSGSCNVQLETSRPILGVPLAGRYLARKEACQHARDLKSSDATDSTTCFDYTAGTVTGCLADGVELPR